MSFFGEMSRRLSADLPAKATGGFNIVNFNGEHVYVEGVGRLIKVTDAEVEMSVGRSRLTVVGSGLTISELVKGSVIISGRIDGESVERK